MKLRTIISIALLYSFVGDTFAGTPVPEIDGTLSIQAIGLLAGAVFLMKKRK